MDCCMMVVGLFVYLFCIVIVMLVFVVGVVIVNGYVL